ncbi:hypothetical protein TVAG_168180 [Trichomonas vaginalis G3]|uniref:DUF3447 domain-containing protein n=1 Tax=Trichomonas vaginalis (strain ATCC PRA-98 / G3) TaxID=412133 RepID=A2FBI6_TRIV3|nr:spectrin binding [Trichomonas vaginalis G3]EAX97721.1 hypothetical protein TVAG_168180 [Trichomonas vaginalis G3]KAI5546014.1 spectrin binding [Trichomonas vaginalis G3]|eukprot:XP_001310651.1 hypothetical protein [Trichomonas vaginalis G3]
MSKKIPAFKNLKFKSICELKIPFILEGPHQAESIFWNINSENSQDSITNLKQLINEGLISKKIFDSFTHAVVTERIQNKMQSIFLCNVYNTVSKPYLIPNDLKQLYIQYSSQICKIIQSDDVEEYKTKMEVSPPSNSSQSHVGLAAEFGSVNIFMYLKDHISEDPKIVRKAIKGGNFDIINYLFKQQPEEFKYTLKFAIKSHRNDVADWLLKNVK